MVNKLSWTRKQSNYSLLFTTGLWSLFFFDCPFFRFRFFPDIGFQQLSLWIDTCPVETSSWLTCQEGASSGLFEFFCCFPFLRQGTWRWIPQVEMREQLSFEDVCGFWALRRLLSWNTWAELQCVSWETCSVEMRVWIRDCAKETRHSPSYKGENGAYTHQCRTNSRWHLK